MADVVYCGSHRAGAQVPQGAWRVAPEPHHGGLDRPDHRPWRHELDHLGGRARFSGRSKPGSLEPPRALDS